MKVSLVRVKSDGSAKEFPVDRLPAIIGRDEGVRLRIPLPAISRKHCELYDDDGELMVKDLGSANGTYVNGTRSRSSEITPGDVLSVGPIVFVVKIDGRPERIDAKDAYMMGIMTSANPDDDEDDDLRQPGKPLAGLGSGGSAGKDENFGDLLKDLDFDDDADKKP